LTHGGFDRRIAFEAASALGTVGLSMGVTSELSDSAKLVGRIGPFALVAAMSPLRLPTAVEPPRDRILLG
jgi:trk system potassium uptake protein TrkH